MLKFMLVTVCFEVAPAATNFAVSSVPKPGTAAQR